MRTHRPPTNEELDRLTRVYHVRIGDPGMIRQLSTEVKRLREVCKREIYVLQGFRLLSDFDSHLRDEITTRLRAAAEGR